ncbi:UDP-2,3-diacylglucosamine diphosphatase [Candidatus Palauibacter sp.]|uniref:UDP-2,3-diacylglucosamine diphosphatase n=1 Tax=Candidatus Palauibacter sp. TaxID=3101350 RepID=UPI003AF26651
MSERTVVVSDVHLGAVAAENERAFLAFLTEVPRWGDELLINGDLFDFWFEYREVIPRGQLDALARLRALVEGGIRVSFMGGNHDAWGGSFLRDEVGIEVLEEPARRPVGGRRAYIAHGDGLGGADWGYRALRCAARSRAGRSLFRWIHPDLGVPLARLASGTRRAQARDAEGESPRAARLASYAREVLAENVDVELVVFGHAHRPEVSELAPGRFYLNSGDWLHHNSFAVVTPEEIRLESYGRRGGS